MEAESIKLLSVYLKSSLECCHSRGIIKIFQWSKKYELTNYFINVTPTKEYNLKRHFSQFYLL